MQHVENQPPSNTHDWNPSSGDESEIEPASVRFLEHERPWVSVLEVVVPGTWDVVAMVYRTLHDLRAQIVHAVIRYQENGDKLQFQLDLVEFDGAKLGTRRLRELIDGIIATLRLVAGLDDTSARVLVPAAS
jgi:hypothetical protein